jgi:hypothetical protein
MVFQAFAAEDVAADEDNGGSVGLGADSAVICETSWDNRDDTAEEVLFRCLGLYQ